MQVKHCPKCLEDKPPEEFARNIARADGLQSWCRACRAACQRKYRETHPEKVESYTKRWRAGHPEQARNQERKYREGYLAAHPGVSREASRRNYSKNRVAVFEHYGWTCACCATAERLTIDHVDGGGRGHRAEIGESSNALYRWLVKNGFPEGFQTLCGPCNRSKGESEACRINHLKAET